MSYSTQPAFIHEGDWDSVSDSHPAMKWMGDYTRQFDKGVTDALYEKYVDPSFVYAKADGSIHPAGKASWAEVVKTYSFFTKYHHEPYFLTCWERSEGDGWAMIGNAWLYANLPGDGSAPKPHTDLAGEKWEIKVPGGFHFVYKKASDGVDGLRLATTSVTSDSGPVVVELLKRGVVKPSDLGL